MELLGQLGPGGAWPVGAGTACSDIQECHQLMILIYNLLFNDKT